MQFVQHNKSRKLVFLIPTGLTPGSHFLDVRARMPNSADLRSGRLDSPLTVV